MHRIFVYGTLRYGEGNHHFLKHAKCLDRQSWVYGTLFDTKHGYPVMKESDENKIYGEVYEVTDVELALIDELEGYEENGGNNLYERIAVNVFNDQGGKTRAITYKTGKTLSKSIDLIESGDWKLYRLAKNKISFYGSED